VKPLGGPDARTGRLSRSLANIIGMFKKRPNPGIAAARKGQGRLTLLISRSVLI
jgi:hypothetical protein